MIITQPPIEKYARRFLRILHASGINTIADLREFTGNKIKLSFDDKDFVYVCSHMADQQQTISYVPRPEAEPAIELKINSMYGFALLSIGQGDRKEDCRVIDSSQFNYARQELERLANVR